MLSDKEKRKDERKRKERERRKGNIDVLGKLTQGLTKEERNTKREKSKTKTKIM